MLNELSLLLIETDGIKRISRVKYCVVNILWKSILTNILNEYSKRTHTHTAHIHIRLSRSTKWELYSCVDALSANIVKFARTHVPQFNR